MVTASQSWNTSAILCVMKIMPIPCFLRSRTVSNNTSTSFSEREDVGSSKIKIFAFSENDFAISTICCCPIESLPTNSFGSTSRPTLSRNGLAASAILSLLTIPKEFFISLPRKMFSAIVRYGSSASS